MPVIKIDSARCKKDSLCIVECPHLLFTQQPDGTAQPVPEADAHCIDCGHCIAICPANAISLDGIDSEGCEPVQRDLAVSPAQVRQLLRSRRSIRTFKQQPLERSKVEELIDISRWAPTARNMQPVCWLVLEQPHIAALSELVIAWMRESNLLPEVVQMYDSGVDIIHRQAPCLLIAHTHQSALIPHVDCTIALSAIETACQPMGLGACWAGFLMMAAKNSATVAEYLQLPEGHTMQGALMLGIPAYRYKRIPPRKKSIISWR
ncbi:nitroreductase family protein [Oleidesulfovibrio sp.]|uniref:nitroreductase family protein n=1 Tax=Oleidesulfovibrio sp. TaxID=2909707 RepID=UPI003A8696FA